VRRSFLCLYDLDADTADVLLETDRLIEAPNWAPDDRYLLVNGNGGLFRVPLDAPKLISFDTGPHREINNDHGISPDGATIAFCDKQQTGKSAIYLTPSEGCAVSRVTEKVPSWWHGWSPDGARLAYTVVRDAQFGIATCAVDGSDERIVIGGPGHYDGPDYAPDGGGLWFNSSRSGSMQIWRIPPDGTGAEQITDADRDAWFPHPSPDGRHVLYLVYPPDTEGHPRDCNVALRLIDLKTGADRELLRLFGGQGTINVPCWAPDGRRFAFMRYAHPGK
jgi:Tol biopolymer transport system component